MAKSIATIKTLAGFTSRKKLTRHDLTPIWKVVAFAFDTHRCEIWLTLIGWRPTLRPDETLRDE